MDFFSSFMPAVPSQLPTISLTETEAESGDGSQISFESFVSLLVLGNSSLLKPFIWIQEQALCSSMTFRHMEENFDLFRPPPTCAFEVRDGLTDDDFQLCAHS